MALTILEAAKLNSGNVILGSVVEVFARQSDLLRVLPFRTIQGNALKYNQEDALPGIAFRGVNEAYSESTGVLNPVTEPLVIAGGELDVDTFITATMGPEQRSTHELMKAKALAQKWSQTFIKGDSVSEPREFDGLQGRVTGTQLIANGATAGGDPLSLGNLDEAIDAVDGPTHLLMTKALRRRLTAATRSTTVGGFITQSKDEFGRPITEYNGLPILIADENGNTFPMLAFDEANPGGGSAVGTSIYVMSFGDGQMQGIQNGDIRVTDIGELESKPATRTRVEWFSGIAVFHPRSVARLWGVTNAAVVA